VGEGKAWARRGQCWVTVHTRHHQAAQADPLLQNFKKHPSIDAIVTRIATCDNELKLHGFHHFSEFPMSTLDHPAIYDDLLDLLAESADAQRVLAFRLSDEKQAQLDKLLEKNREGTLTGEESAELDVYERFEHLVRLLKARVLQKQDS
jgi:hypothetical protein